MQLNKRLLQILSVLALSQAGLAASPASFTYEGALTDTAGNPVDLNGQTITFSIVDNASCVIYQETSTAAGDSNGLISHAVGTGTVTFGTFSSALFNSAQNGSGCTTTATAPRLLKVSVNALSITATVNLTSVPYAFESTAVGGYSANSLLRTDNTVASVSPLNNTEYNKLLSLIAGTSTQYVQQSAGANPVARDILQFNGTGWVSQNIPICAANQYLTFNGSTYTCANDSTGSGTVSSVNVGVPAYMFSSGGPVTSSGTITVGFNTQTAHTVFAGPTTGSSAPSFRSLDASDISSGILPVSRGGTGLSSFSNNSIFTTNASGDLNFFNCPDGNLMSYSAGALSCFTHDSKGLFSNGGNSFGGAATLGTNDNNNFNIETANSTRVLIDTQGKVLIGTLSEISPTAKLQVTGESQLDGEVWVENKSSSTIGRTTTLGLTHFSIGTGSSAAPRLQFGASKSGGTVPMAANDEVGRIEFDNPYSGWKNGAAIVARAATGGSGWTASTQGTQLEFYTNANASTGFSGTLRMTVDQAGNVGVGTNSPAARLDVLGTTKLGISGVAFTSMGNCSIPAFSGTLGGNTKTCTGLPAGAVVHCSPTSTPGTITWSSWANATGQVTIQMTGTSTLAAWNCMWMQP